MLRICAAVLLLCLCPALPVLYGAEPARPAAAKPKLKLKPRPKLKPQPRPGRADTIIMVAPAALDAANSAVIKVAGPRAAGTFTVIHKKGQTSRYVASGNWLKPAQLAELKSILKSQISAKKVTIIERGAAYKGKAKARLKKLGYKPLSTEIVK